MENVSSLLQPVQPGDQLTQTKYLLLFLYIWCLTEKFDAVKDKRKYPLSTIVYKINIFCVFYFPEAGILQGFIINILSNKDSWNKSKYPFAIFSITSHCTGDFLYILLEVTVSRESSKNCCSRLIYHFEYWFIYIKV